MREEGIIRVSESVSPESTGRTWIGGVMARNKLCLCARQHGAGRAAVMSQSKSCPTPAIDSCEIGLGTCELVDDCRIDARRTDRSQADLSDACMK